MASDQLRVNCTCSYYSYWCNMLIQTFVFDCSMEQREFLALTTCFWNRVHVMPGTIRTKTIQWYLRFHNLKTFTKLHTAGSSNLLGNAEQHFWKLPIVMCESVPAARKSPQGKPPGIPRAFEKNRSNARPCGQFLLANAPLPVPTVWSTARPSSPSDQYRKLLVTIF